MSSSESEEDENLKKFAEAVDVKLFNDTFYKPKDEKINEEEKIEKTKSQRYLDEENVFHSEINVPETMKNYIYKKMSDNIDKEIEFIDVKRRKKEFKEKDDCCVKLLSGFDTFISDNDPADQLIKQQKVLIKRKVIEDNNEKESDKIRSAVISINEIEKEVNSWSEENKKPAFNFKTTSDGKSHYQEPFNEYTEARRRNNWNESMIRDAKFYGKSIKKIISNT